VTIPERTVVDLGATSPWLVERALSTGIRLELFTIADVAGVLRRVGRKGRSGVGVIRPFLEMHQSVDGRTESLLEDKFLRVLFDRGIAMPLVQYEVLDDRGMLVCRAGSLSKSTAGRTTLTRWPTSGIARNRTKHRLLVGQR
jgi:hypothetical protein